MYVPSKRPESYAEGEEQGSKASGQIALHWLSMAKRATRYLACSCHISDVFGDEADVGLFWWSGLALGDCVYMVGRKRFLHFSSLM